MHLVVDVDESKTLFCITLVIYILLGEILFLFWVGLSFPLHTASNIGLSHARYIPWWVGPWGGGAEIIHFEIQGL